MNPVSQAVREGDFPPMAEVRKTLKIDWYLCPIDRKVLSLLVQKSDAKGLIQAAGHFGL